MLNECCYENEYALSVCESCFCVMSKSECCLNCGSEILNNPAGIEYCVPYECDGCVEWEEIPRDMYEQA